MELTEKKNSDYLLSTIHKELANIYQSNRYGNYHCYINKQGVLFRPFCFSTKELAFGLEYASNAKEAECNMFEDGDIFYFNDYSSAHDMIEDMCAEIDKE